MHKCLARQEQLQSSAAVRWCPSCILAPNATWRPSGVHIGFSLTPTEVSRVKAPRVNSYTQTSGARPAAYDDHRHALPIRRQTRTLVFP